MLPWRRMLAERLDVVGTERNRERRTDRNCASRSCLLLPYELFKLFRLACL